MNNITFTFHFDLSLTRNLRDAINEKRNLSQNKEGQLNNKKNINYLAFDRICAIMDRLDDTIQYVNDMTLGDCSSPRSAFDFYDFINCAYVIIDCIRTIGQIFKLDNSNFESIEKAQEVFGNVLMANGTDGLFFEYIRSLCSVHPSCTSRSKYPYLQEAPFHCCPCVMWKHKHQSAFYNRDGDLIAYVYTSQKGDPPILISLFVNQFESYLGKWIDLIPSVIEAIHNYNSEIYEKFRNERIQTLSDFDNDVVRYLRHLKSEYIRRYGNESDAEFDDCIRAFSIRLSNSENEKKLQKYRNAILYSIGFLHNALQNMTFDGYENNGFAEPRRDFDLFSIVSSPPFFQNKIGIETYNLEKAYYLQPGTDYTSFDKAYARQLLSEEKEKLNQIIVFTGEESDEETIVLIQLVKYLLSLTYKNSLNKNIPNDEKYRETLLSDDELKELFEEEAPSDALNDFLGLKFEDF